MIMAVLSEATKEVILYMLLLYTHVSIIHNSASDRGPGCCHGIDEGKERHNVVCPRHGCTDFAGGPPLSPVLESTSGAYLSALRSPDREKRHGMFSVRKKYSREHQYGQVPFLRHDGA